MIFKLLYFDTYSSDQLSGKGGIIDSIKRMLCDKVQYKTIKTVILDTLKATEEGQMYNASRKKFIKQKCRKIQSQTYKMHLLTKFKSAGA